MVRQGQSLCRIEVPKMAKLKLAPVGLALKRSTLERLAQLRFPLVQLASVDVHLFIWQRVKLTHNRATLGEIEASERKGLEIGNVHPAGNEVVSMG